MVVSKKKKKMKKILGCYIISLGTREYDTSNSLLIDSEEEQIVLMADPIPFRGTQSGKAYLN